MASKARQAPRRLYWDSCLFISYIEKYQARYADIDALLDEARRGEVEILTSVATIAEVSFTESERLQRALDPAEEQRINDLWTPPSPVRLVEFHRLIAEGARDLMRFSMTNQWKLTTYDALHLSTAKFMRVDRMETYDKDLYRYAPQVSCVVGPPFVGQLTIGHSTGSPGIP